MAGPTPNQQIEIISNSSNLTNEKYTPLSSLDYVDSNNIHPQSSSQELSQFPQSQSQQSVNVNVREEWLLTPGERKPFGGKNIKLNKLFNIIFVLFLIIIIIIFLLIFRIIQWNYVK